MGIVQMDNLEILSDGCFQDFLIILHHLTGITIAQNRNSMVQGRLRKRIFALNMKSYESYLELLKSDENEKIVFIDLMTTNETHFFRTSRIWSYLTDSYIPNWYSKNKTTVFTAWSAAAATGEEALSLGMICESFKERNPGFQYQILGTDISREMVEKCRKGIYSGRSLESFKANQPDLFAKYMRLTGDSSFCVVSEINRNIKFYEHNLFNNLKSEKEFDLVLLRNVLIYFTCEDQERVLAKIHPKLSAEGCLIIGESESLAHLKSPVARVEPLIYKKTA